MVPKVAIDARLISTKNTGDTSYWKGLIRGLAEWSEEVDLLLYSNSPAPSVVPAVFRDKWVHLPGANSRWWSLVAFPLAARKAGAQVVHTQYNVSPLAKNPVTTVHDVSFFIGPEWFKPRDRFLLRTQIPASIRRAKRVLTVSETSRREIERFIPAAIGKTVVTYDALGENIDPSVPSNTMYVDGPYLFTIGTRWPRKNLALALAAANLLPDSLPHKLVVSGQAGWGDLPDCPRAVYTGFVDDHDLSALYKGADLYLCPSFHEGFGIPLLEAFACQCPVICSAGGSLPEVAANAALVVPDFSPQTWANTITATLGDPGKLDDMRAKGLKRVGDFSWKTTARQTLDVYKEVAGA